MQVYLRNPVLKKLLQWTKKKRYPLNETRADHEPTRTYTERLPRIVSYHEMFFELSATVTFLSNVLNQD